MDFAQLQFAATVRELAAKIRNGERHKLYTSLINQPKQEKDDAMRNWDAKNLVIDYIPKALGLIQEAAKIIEQVKDQTPSHRPGEYD